LTTVGTSTKESSGPVDVPVIETGRRAIFASAFRHRSIRRIALAYTTFKVSEMGVWIAITAVAHHFGGLREATIVLLAQLGPATIVGGSVGGLVQRFGSRRTLTGGLVVQAAGVTATGVVLAAGGPRWPAYVAAVVAAIAVTTTRPSVAAMLPNLVESPRTLAATNVALGWIDGSSTLVGPVIAAVLMGVHGYGAPFLAFGGLLAFGAAATVTLRESERHFVELDEERVSVRSGLKEVARSKPPRTVLIVLGAQGFAAGTLDLIFVIVAVDILGKSNADAGWLSAAYGVGAVIGAAVTLVLVGRRALWPAVVGAAVLMVVGFSMIGLAQQMSAAAAVMAICGVGSAALLTSGRTLLQRVTGLRLLSHTFSIAEALEMSMLMLGVIAVPALTELVGSRWVGLGVAVVLIAVIGATIKALIESERSSNVSIDRIEALHDVDLLGLLPAAALETLAREATPTSVSAGTQFITQGDLGDRYYVLTAGRVSVRCDGVEVAELGPGSGVGELALLYEARRTADVVAVDDVEALAVGSEPFLLVVTGHSPTAAHAEHVADSYVVHEPSTSHRHPIGRGEGPRH
jgi:MFS family permease